MIGAGSAGVMVAREVSANPQAVGFEVLGFLDDDPDNCGSCGFDCPDDGWCEDGRCVVEGGEAEAFDD